MPAGPRLARRTTLAVAAGVVVLSGCDDGDPGDPADPTGSAAATADPDVALVDGVLAELDRAQRIAAAAGADDLVALHAAHLEALGATSTTPLPAPARPRDLARHEQQLQTHLVEAAVAARSGALAALLASMSAAQSQVLAQPVVTR